MYTDVGKMETHIRTNTRKMTYDLRLEVMALRLEMSSHFVTLYWRLGFGMYVMTSVLSALIILTGAR